MAGGFPGSRFSLETIFIVFLYFSVDPFVFASEGGEKKRADTVQFVWSFQKTSKKDIEKNYLAGSKISIDDRFY